jgi:cysteine desulfurase
MSTLEAIYLDNQATTRLDPRVLAAMMPYLTSDYGNAASRTHMFGWRAEEAISRARDQVARLIGAEDREIVFTSGATEAINLAIKGVAEAYRDQGDHIVTTAIEHKAVLDSCQHLGKLRLADRSRIQANSSLDAKAPPDDGGLVSGAASGAARIDELLRIVGLGCRVTLVGVGTEGVVKVEDAVAAMSNDTVLVAVMLANNEIGTIQPVRRIAEQAKSRGAIVFSDIAQALGKIPIDVNELSVDLASLSSHKIYGPKGVGALYVRSQPRVRLAALIDGGGHERGFRSGTLDVPGIVGFGQACEIAGTEMSCEQERIGKLRDRLRELLWKKLSGLSLNGSMQHRLPGNLNISFEGIESEALMMGIPAVALSSGSACTSASLDPSYVLKACGVTDLNAYAAIRFSIGRFNTQDEIDFVADAVAARVTELRGIRLL